ncbi:tripartite motif-containing protein 45-like [Dendronephthya gigantea]|uniref:tripartite motif-containing protein 45-like n=1 Tax=Dendronephthya gigantea TaxID=151771 RepID=UPI00106AF419|nr:tripartite motif-containing protein 45-like [Dendronephthya gigantea]
MYCMSGAAKRPENSSLLPLILQRLFGNVVKTCRDEAPRGRPVREFPCPNCREMFTLDPDKNVADMRRNHFICNIVKATAVLNRDRRTGVPCSHNCSQSYSVARCVTCEKFLCQECLTIHDSYRGHTGHFVLTMEELSKPENRKKIKDKMYCNEHPGEILKVYCETCDQLICKDCMDFKHTKQDHSCFLVKDVANKYKELLASKNETMDGVLAENNSCLEELSQATQQLDRDAEDVKTKIKQRKQFILKNVAEVLHEKAEILLNRVEVIHTEAREKIDKQILERKQFGENLQNSVYLSKKLVEQGTEEEIISSQKMTLDSANNLLIKQQKEHYKLVISVVKFNYSNSDYKKPLNKGIREHLMNSLGEIKHLHEDADAGEAKHKIKKEDPSSTTTQESLAVGEDTTEESLFNTRSAAEEYLIDISSVVYKNVNISVYQGDITNESADVIVSPADKDLTNDGKTARAIVRVGGRSIQDESTEIMKKRHNKPLNPGDLVVTKAGNLPCKFIIHALGPKLREYQYKEDAVKKVLFNTILRCLKLADQHGATSISISAISCGGSGVPVPICAEVLFEAATNFAKNAPKSNKLKNIRFVDINKRTSKAFVQEMKRRFGSSVQTKFRIADIVYTESQCKAE